MKRRLLLGLLLLAAICGQTLSVRADGLVRDGVGPISTGRGGTNQGFADNSVIILDNPGALVNVEGNGLAEAGVDTAITAVDYSNPFNDVNSKIRPLPAPVLGYIRKSEDGRWAWGIGAFAPAGFGASYGVMNNPVTGPALYKSLGALGKILPALSYRVNDRLSVGGTFGLGVCHVQLDGPFFLQSGVLAGVPAILDLQGTGAAPTGSVGMQYQLTPNTVFGATYTEQTNFDLRGPVQAVLLPGFPLASSFDAKMRLKWPRSVAVGLKHDICPHRRVAVDVIWYDWAHAFDQLNLQLSNPSNPAVAALLASVGSSLPIRDVFPMHWTNSVSTRIGYEVDWTDLDTWRFGYAYHGSPVPDSTLNPYLDGVLNHAFSIGYSRKLGGGAIINAAYQYNFGANRHVGTSSIIGGDFNNSSLDAQAHFAMLSLLCPF
jgi:long-subunit fatty acid transport protein